MSVNAGMRRTSSGVGAVACLAFLLAGARAGAVDGSLPATSASENVSTRSASENVTTTSASETAPATLGWLDAVRWFNARPLTPADLRGKVVLVEFWTFACVNCQRSVPAMLRLHQSVGGGDVLIIGVHSPELDRERSAAGLKAAIRRFHLHYAVAQDNDFVAWRAFDNHYWPALYVLDGHGRIRGRHVGELHVGSAAWTDLLETIEKLRKERG